MGQNKKYIILKLTKLFYLFLLIDFFDLLFIYFDF